MKKNKKIYFPDLSWRLEDYIKNNKEVPDRIKKNPQKTEGEMMSEEEIEGWFLESIRTLKVLKEEDSKTFDEVYKNLFIDLEYLLSLDRIDEGVLDFINDLNNFDF